MARHPYDPEPQQSTAGSTVSKTFAGAFQYRTCRPDEYLIKTGAGCNAITPLKGTYQWPRQLVTVITLAPRNYSFTLEAVTSDLIPFSLPMVFTIGPHDPVTDADAFNRYATKMSAMTVNEMHEIVLGIVHGQTRLCAAGLTAMQIFNDRDTFKMHVTERVSKELIPLGLHAYNANVAELTDVAGNSFFSSLKQKAISATVNDTRVAVAKAKRDGDVGESAAQKESAVRLSQIEKDKTIAKQEADTAAKVRLAEIAKDQIIAQQEFQAAERIRLAEVKRDADIAQQESLVATKVRIAELDSDAMTKKNLAEQQIAKSKLELVNSDCQKSENTRRVEAENGPKVKAAELAIELNKKEADARLEKLRATELAQVTCDAEAKVTQAEADAKSVRLAADAALYAQQKAAEGVRANLEAKAEGMKQLLAVADPDLVKFWLALDNGLFIALAEKTAAAVQGLQPKINVWTTTSGGDAGSDCFSPLQKLFQTLPPMLDAVEGQTNVRMPSWMPSTSRP